MESKTLYLILQILPAVVILFWAVAIFFKKGIRKSQLLMVAGMVMAIFSTVDRNMAVLFIYPLFFLAIREVTLRGDIPKWDWLIFLPSLVRRAENPGRDQYIPVPADDDFFHLGCGRGIPLQQGRRRILRYGE